MRTPTLLDRFENLFEDFGQTIEKEGFANREAYIKGANIQKKAIEGIAQSNYELAKVTKQTEYQKSRSIEKIAIAKEQDSITREYYLLQEKIEQYEEWLIEKGLLERAYEEINLEEVEKIQITQKDIELATSLYNGQDAEKIIQFCANNKISVIDYYVKKLIGKRLYFYQDKIWVDGEVLINNYNNIGSFEYYKRFAQNTYGKLCFKIENYRFYFKTDLEDVLYESDPTDYFITEIMDSKDPTDYYKKASFQIQSRLVPKYSKGLEREEQEQELISYATRIYIIPSKQELIFMLKNVNDPVADLDISSMFSNIKLKSDINNLRNLYEQLRLVVKKYKLELTKK